MTDQIVYDVIEKIDTLEIRQYPELIFAVVENDMDDSGFNLLFRYISGENKTQSKIRMTAPVITSEKMKMTAPVVSRDHYMAFAIPSAYNKDTVPIPINPSVKIEVQPKKIMAVLKFNGRTSEKIVQKYIQELINILKTHKIQIKAEPVLMRYNSPFTPGFLRRNEVAAEIIKNNKK
jgi:uncharacterized protein YqgV (UPF0045/DUF77 family)